MNCVTCGEETTFYVESVDHLIPVCNKECWNIHMAGGGSLDATPAPSNYPMIGRNRTSIPVAAVPPDEPIGSADESKRDERKTNG